MPPVLVTAFSSFGGREQNASSLALAELRTQHAGLRWRTLPVDHVEAPRRLRAAVKQLRPTAVLLLGEAAQTTTLRLETRAWNQLDYPIPDFSGRQPRARPISPSAPPFLTTRVDVGPLLARLQRAGHRAEASTDPGRYLCNRIYFDALGRLEVPCIFVHLPLDSRLPPAAAASALRTILDHFAPAS